MDGATTVCLLMKMRMLDWETRERTSAWYIFLRGPYVSVHFFPNLPDACCLWHPPKNYTMTYRNDWTQDR